MSVLRGQGGPGALRQKGGAWGERPGEEEEEGRRQARQRIKEEGGGQQARQQPRQKPQEQGLLHWQPASASVSLEPRFSTFGMSSALGSCKCGLGGSSEDLL